MPENLNDPFVNRPSRDTDDAPAYLTRHETSGDENTTMWGWIAGAAVLALVAAFIFGGNNSSQMADQGSGTVPGVTRSTQSPSGALPTSPSPNTARAPDAVPSTTGSGSSTTGSGSSNQQ